MKRIPRSVVIAGLAVALVAATASHAASLSNNAGGQIGPGDLVQIRVAHMPEISEKPVRLDAQGFINLPMVGRVNAVGSVQALTGELQHRLERFLKNPEVAVEVVETKSKSASVLGAVKAPGNYQIVNQTRLLDLIGQAGGLEADAGYAVRITRRLDDGRFPDSVIANDRGDYSVAELRVTDLMNAAHPDQNIAIQAGDSVTIPRAQLIYVVGEVRRAGGFPLRERETLSVLQALSLAEGMGATAASSKAKIIRPVDGQRQEIAINVGRILSGKDADPTMRPDDVLFIPSSTAKKALTRGMEAALQMGTGVVIWRR